MVEIDFTVLAQKGVKIIFMLNFLYASPLGAISVLGK